MTLNTFNPLNALRRTPSEKSNMPPPGERELLDVCVLPVDAALSRLGATDKGLDLSQVQERRAKYGLNEVSKRKKLGFIAEILQRCRNPLVIQLFVISGVSYAMGDLRAAIVVGVMIVLSVFLGYFQETRSSQAVEKLRAMVQTTCSVLRGGKEMEIAMNELVPGDIVIFAAGSIIPADIRLLSAKDCFVSQSALTGESMPIEKSVLSGTTTAKAALDLPNACFQGSNVLSGSARGLVVNIGINTYFGTICEKLATQRILTSFD